MCCGIIRGRNFGCICIRSGSFIPGRIKSSRRARIPRLRDRGSASSGWFPSVLCFVVGLAVGAAGLTLAVGRVNLIVKG